MDQDKTGRRRKASNGNDGNDGGAPLDGIGALRDKIGAATPANESTTRLYLAAYMMLCALAQIVATWSTALVSTAVEATAFALTLARRAAERAGAAPPPVRVLRRDDARAELVDAAIALAGWRPGDGPLESLADLHADVLHAALDLGAASERETRYRVQRKRGTAAIAHAERVGAFLSVRDIGGTLHGIPPSVAKRHHARGVVVYLDAVKGVQP